MIIFVDIFFVIGNLVLYSWLIDFNDEECNKNDVEGVKEVRNNVEGFLGFNFLMLCFWDFVMIFVMLISNFYIYKSCGFYFIDFFV